MVDQGDNNNLTRLVFYDNNEERKSWAYLGQTCSRSLTVFLSQLFPFLVNIFSCFWKIHVSKTCAETIVWLTFFCVVQLDIFHHQQEYEQVSF